jgi:hypothetical protein
MIVTFYSYKGGVGRSMAVANIAVLMARVGLRVLVVDADLEAPGVESYLSRTALGMPERQDLLSADELRARPGFIDMLYAYRERMADKSLKPSDSFPTFEEYVTTLVREDQGELPGSVSILTAGDREAEDGQRYSQRLNALNWTEFYENWGGDVYFEWLRQRLNEAADIVFIDSRTGLTDMGGVTARILADLVIAVCAPNDQNRLGTKLVIQGLFSSDLAEARRSDQGERPLDVFVLPSRVDREAAPEAYARFARTLLDTLRALPGADHHRLKVLTDNPIPYAARCSFEERLVVPPPPLACERTSAYASDALIQAYQSVAGTLLDWMLDRVSPVARPIAVRPVLYLISASPEDRSWAYLLKLSIEAALGDRVSLGLFDPYDCQARLEERLATISPIGSLPPILLDLVDPKWDYPTVRWGMSALARRVAERAGDGTELRILRIEIGTEHPTTQGSFAWHRPEDVIQLIEQISQARHNPAVEEDTFSVIANQIEFEKSKRIRSDNKIQNNTVEIRKRLEKIKKESLDWENTTGSARKWWEDFENENNQRQHLILRLTRELESRKATITEFFLSYVYSNCDNIQANLHYLDYRRLKQEEDRKKDKTVKIDLADSSQEVDNVEKIEIIEAEEGKSKE